jgi:hypothetical protein
MSVYGKIRLAQPIIGSDIIRSHILFYSSQMKFPFARVLEHQIIWKKNGIYSSHIWRLARSRQCDILTSYLL